MASVPPTENGVKVVRVTSRFICPSFCCYCEVSRLCCYLRESEVWPFPFRIPAGSWACIPACLNRGPISDSAHSLHLGNSSRHLNDQRREIGFAGYALVNLS